MTLFRANEIVRKRQAGIVCALKQAGVPFALSGSNATFVWIASVDVAAARQYRNVEFIIRREDADDAKSALAQLGLMPEARPDHILFRPAAYQRERWSDRAMFADETLRNSACKVPSLGSFAEVEEVPVVRLPQLVEFQLSRWLLDDQVDLRDMIEVGLVGRGWLNRLPAELATRLQELLDDPDG